MGMRGSAGKGDTKNGGKTTVLARCKQKAMDAMGNYSRNGCGNPLLVADWLGAFATSASCPIV